MIHYVNYKLTYLYEGRIPIDATSIPDAEKAILDARIHDLMELATNRSHVVSAKSDPPIDESQLALFDFEEP